MDAQFIWRESYNTGVETLDREHRRLFKIINKLFAFKEDKAVSKWACQESIKFFKEHTLKHFAFEEEYMASINYKWIEQHKRLHRGFSEKTLPALERELERTGYSADAIDHYLGVCAGWLVGHTLTEDLAITGKQTKLSTEVLSDDFLTSTETMIVRLIYDMFHLDAHLISDSYNGDKFGNGVYYRLVYGTPNTKRQQEVIMIFEEKLLLNTTGTILGIRTNRLDNSIIHASRYIAGKFAERVMKQFPTNDEYELQAENLLSYEQFHKIYEKNPPHISLLFSTEAGYYSYCMIAPHLLEADTVPGLLNSENAMAAVIEYLHNQESEHTKPKILLVDDSMVIRKQICELLEDNYAVTPASSSLDAIRSITLNKPDLILLDYEMPVCDGRQMLEMLRTDHEFADIPVIFLTGRSDPESVKKVMSLKPAGYLLKHLDAAEIRKNIDAFFEKKSTL